MHFRRLAVSAFEPQKIRPRVVPVEQDFPRFGGEVAPRNACVERDLFGELPQNPVVGNYYALRPDPPRLDCASRDAFGVVGHGELFARAHYAPDSAAEFARAVGVVEREVSHGKRRVDFAAFFAGKRRA